MNRALIVGGGPAGMTAAIALVGDGVDARDVAARLSERRFERCRLVVAGSLQLSQWEREPDTPGADPGGLIRETFKALAAPI